MPILMHSQPLRAVRPHARAGVEIRRGQSHGRRDEFALMRGRELKCAVAIVRAVRLGSPSCEGGS